MRTFVEKSLIKPRIAKRIAYEFADATETVILNLGVGLPTMVSNYIDNKNVFLQAENGMLGVGAIADEAEADPYLINAGRQRVKETVGCSYFDSSLSFGMIRGGHVDATVIGAFEVDEEATIANWIIPNGRMLGVGGAMDLVSGAKKVIIGMSHFQKSGASKIVKTCSYPVTGCGLADMIVTELGVFSYPDGKLTLTEIAPEISVDELAELTEARFHVADDLKEMYPIEE